MKISPENLLTTRVVLTAAASLTASAAIFYRNAIHEFYKSSVRVFSPELTIVIEEFQNVNLNQMFEAVNLYLATDLSHSLRRIKVNKPDREKDLLMTVDVNQELVDVFQNQKFYWLMLPKLRDESLITDPRIEKRCFELTFKKKNRALAVEHYLPYILDRALFIRKERNPVKLYTIDYTWSDYWRPNNLDHPATFDTIVMDAETKNLLTKDLTSFLQRREYYRRVGKAWKRIYLLFGPSGTGKSSLVAVMAKFLKFDIYDLDLRDVQTYSDLRKLLNSTGNQSLILIEDIDCSASLQDRDVVEVYPKVTASGALDIIDGLWSSCGDERIVVITSSTPNNPDPALLRPGRVDVQIYMPFCTAKGFEELARNYLNIESHPLFEDIKKMIDKIAITPAEVVGELMNFDNADSALGGVLQLLHDKKAMIQDVD